MNFWRLIGWSFVSVLTLSISTIVLFFLLSASRQSLASVGAHFSLGRDPFESTTRAAELIPDGYLYHDGLLQGFSSWAWKASAQWGASEQHYEGTRALKATFAEAHASVGMSGPALASSSLRSISLAVYPDQNVGDVYLGMVDGQGNPLPMQSLSWYAPNKKLQANTWQVITVPLANLTAREISGLTLTSEHAGTVFVDAVRLVPQVLDTASWTMPADFDTWVAYDPFATSTPINVPYTMTPSDASKWYTFFGQLTFGADGMHAGGKPPKDTDSVSVITGGKQWQNYRIQTTVYWQETSVFALLLRVSDSSNYASCAFSRYGEGAQIYFVKNGISQMLGQTPPLAIPDYEPWVDVSLAAEVVGNKVTCYARGEKVLQATIPNLPPKGSVGIESWDLNPYAAPNIIKQFSVNPPE